MIQLDSSPNQSHWCVIFNQELICKLEIKHLLICCIDVNILTFLSQLWCPPLYNGNGNNLSQAKIILQGLTRDEKFYFSVLFHHEIMKWPWLSPYFSSVYLYWLLCILKLKYSEYSFSYACLHFYSMMFTGKYYIADSAKTTAFIFTRIVYFWCFIDLCKEQKICTKNVHRGHTYEQIS